MEKENKRLPVIFWILLSLLLVISIGLISVGIYLMFFKNYDAYERQKQEKNIADNYIDDMILKLTDPKAYEEKVKKEAALRAEEKKKKR